MNWKDVSNDTWWVIQKLKNKERNSYNCKISIVLLSNKLNNEANKKQFISVKEKRRSDKKHYHNWLEIED